MNRPIHFTDKKMEALSKQQGGVYEILYYKKNGHGIWLQEDITPIRNEQRIIVLFLVTFKDITPFKEPLEGPSVMSNLSKFARLAWTITKSRQTLPPSMQNNVGSSNHSSASNLNARGRSPGISSLLGNSSNSKSMPNMTPGAAGGGAGGSGTNGGGVGIGMGNWGGGGFYGPNRFTDSLPEYRHEPPKTPPHILLHYSTFKVSPNPMLSSI